VDTIVTYCFSGSLIESIAHHLKHKVEVLISLD